jgi:hypothetical protein
LFQCVNKNSLRKNSTKEGGGFNFSKKKEKFMNEGDMALVQNESTFNRAKRETGLHREDATPLPPTRLLFWCIYVNEGCMCVGKCSVLIG